MTHRLQQLARTALALWLLAAVLPAVGSLVHAWQADAAPWGVVCSADAAAGSDAGQQGDGAHAGAHCGWCLLQHQAWAPAPQAPALPLALPSGRLLPLLFQQAPRPLFAWAAAQPRAPPQA